MPRPSTVFLAIIIALFGLTLAGLVYFLKSATATASVDLLFSPGLYWWLFALFAQAAVLQTTREAARAIIAAIEAGPDATAAAMRRAVRPASNPRDAAAKEVL